MKQLHLERDSDEDWQRVQLLTVIMHDTHLFLQRWNQFIGDPDRSCEDALIAITELEVALRTEREALLKKLDRDMPPFAP